MHPATNSVNFTFNGSTDGGSNYNVTKTSTLFAAVHEEGDSEATLAYKTPEDLALPLCKWQEDFENIGLELIYDYPFAKEYAVLDDEKNPLLTATLSALEWFCNLRPENACAIKFSI
jgi:hypothetical protein